MLRLNDGSRTVSWLIPSYPRKNGSKHARCCFKRKKSLGELFDGRSQLIVYHFMLGPGWKAGCPGCSFLSDHIDGALPHLNHHDVTMVAVSRAPLAKIEAYKKRM